MDGTIPDKAEERSKKLEELMHLRRINRNFNAEKILPS
jgi:hypothetical protein